MGDRDSTHVDGTDLIGARLAHYRIDAQLGAGGMGVVYRARDLQLERDVAIKVLLPGTEAEAGIRERLLREARAASALNHPCVCHVYQVGQAEGRDFIAMELVAGGTLRSLAQPRGLPIEAVIRYGIQIADALAHAHERGVIHRDLKTDNVIITPAGRVKVLDFGLAKRLHEPSVPSSSSLTLTAPGTVVGTPAYLAPEVLCGAEADARSDLWALGVVLHEMITGQVPFGGATLVEVYASILNHEPEPVPAKTPVGLRVVVGRCLAKEPGRRYAQAGEARAALEALAVDAGPAGRSAFSRRSWIPAGVAAALLLAGLVAYAVREWRSPEGAATGVAAGPRIRSLAVLPFANLSADREQEYFSDGITDELITDLASLRSLKVISRTSTIRFRGTSQAVPQIARELGVDGVIEGSVLRSGGRVRITAQLLDAARDQHLWAQSYERDLSDVLALQREVASDIAAQIGVRLSPEEREHFAGGRPVNAEANDLYLRGRYLWAVASDVSVRQALVYFRRAIAIDSLDARYHSGVADCYIVLALAIRSVSFAEALPRARVAATRALALDESSSEAHASMGVVSLWADWDWARAERELRRAIELKPGYDGAHIAYATLLGAAGRDQEALTAARRANELNPLSQIANYCLARELFQSRRFDAALAEVRRGIELGPNSEWGHGLQARIYEENGRYEEALNEYMNLPRATIEAMRKGLATEGPRGYWRAYLGFLRQAPNSSSVLTAVAYAKLGDVDQAIRSIEDGLRQREADCLFVAVIPGLDNVRADSRFAAIAGRIGIPWRSTS